MPQNCNLWRCRLPFSLGERPIVTSAQSHLFAPQTRFQHPIFSQPAINPIYPTTSLLSKLSENLFPTTFPLLKTLKHSTDALR
jgi:hypothetical protein